MDLDKVTYQTSFRFIKNLQLKTEIAMQSNNLKYTPWTAKNEGSKQDMSGRFHAILTGSTLLL